MPLSKLNINKLIKNKIQPDIFISTWALSESNSEAQNFVKTSNYFNSKNILIGYQKNNASFPFSTYINKLPDGFSVIYEAET